MRRSLSLPVSLVASAASLAALALVAPSPVVGQARAGGAAAQAPAAAARVNDDLIRRAEPAEWLTYGHDYAETHYSPLDAIDDGNVGRLGLAWTWQVPGTSDRLESTPLVHEGVMYASGTYSTVFALDARTGALKWMWDPAIVRGGFGQGGPAFCCGPNNRGVALYEGKVFAGLLDGRLVALDAATGRVIWVRQTTPIGDEYSITGAPRVVKGKVVIGNGGAEYGVRGYVTAYDPDTGEELWRFYTVPGNPEDGFENVAMEIAASSWVGEWWALGGGGTVWDAMAYDPELDLLYLGTGNGSPWSRDIRSAGEGDNLYLSSIVAIDPDDGTYRWHYQTTPGDDWDYTATQPILLADITIGGVERQVLMQAPKNGFFYVIDRRNGEFISAQPYAHTTWATSIDQATGRPVETPIARYDEVGSWISPGPLGAHNWEPMSFNPETGLVYLPGQNSQYFYRRNPAFEAVPGRFNLGTGGRGAGPQPVMPTAPTPAGYLVAWDPAANRERWRVPYDQGRNAGTLTTGGNLVFTGQASGEFYAYDATSGRQLWEYQLPAGLGSPITYELDGRQYVTILAGRQDSGEQAGRVWTFALDGSAPRP